MTTVNCIDDIKVLEVVKEMQKHNNAGRNVLIESFDEEKTKREDILFKLVDYLVDVSKK